MQFFYYFRHYFLGIYYRGSVVGGGTFLLALFSFFAQCMSWSFMWFTCLAFCLFQGLALRNRLMWKNIWRCWSLNFHIHLHKNCSTLYFPLVISFYLSTLIPIFFSLVFHCRSFRFALSHVRSVYNSFLVKKNVSAFYFRSI